jgi:hypothetical protein
VFSTERNNGISPRLKTGRRLRRTLLLKDNGAIYTSLLRDTGDQIPSKTTLFRLEPRLRIISLGIAKWIPEMSLPNG